MDDTAKYVIHADITADGVVERSDVVGAVFGQTEGLLGDDLDLRDLQQSSKLGRIDVDIDSENGQSFGTVTIASSLDKVETSILAAALETITRVGPCRASISIASIEDVRAAKRRKVVERAKQLLADAFDEDVMNSREILEEVRQSARVEDIVEFEGLPAGPHVEDSDAIIVVEGRADVLNLLRYGVKNAIAVEGTNVPDAVAELTQDRNVTVFLDGDRGGDLIRKELAQVGDIDYVALAPAGKSVEDLARHEVMSALRSKRPFEKSSVESDSAPTTAATDGSAHPAPETDPDISGLETPETAETTDTVDATETTESSDTAGSGSAASVEMSASSDSLEVSTVSEPATTPETTDENSTDVADQGTTDTDSASADAESVSEDDSTDNQSTTAAEPTTLLEHVEAVVGEETASVRLLDSSFETLAEADESEAFDTVKDADETPYAVVLDGRLEQRVLDVAAQRGVNQIVARELGEFVKQPASVRVRTADDF
ncbi:DNA primase DnaG [Halorussus halophilus]|uniref:DNA primase DnaG n=1 Tax=Halorussus halophilus TaxID=2650975 RepID=UPI001301720B|nr:DNA primase DnaG [Halorussus halophilus]